jgi:hypothetical protein
MRPGGLQLLALGCSQPSGEDGVVPSRDSAQLGEQAATGLGEGNDVDTSVRPWPAGHDATPPRSPAVSPAPAPTSS